MGWGRLASPLSRPDLPRGRERQHPAGASLSRRVLCLRATPLRRSPVIPPWGSLGWCRAGRQARRRPNPTGCFHAGLPGIGAPLGTAIIGGAAWLAKPGIASPDLPVTIHQLEPAGGAAGLACSDASGGKLCADV